MAQEDSGQISTAGWDAINAAMAALYPGQEPRHFGTLLSHTLGGNDPLDGISVYWSDTPVRIGITSATAFPSCTTSRATIRRRAASVLS